jgi:hypothetical protein
MSKAGLDCQAPLLYCVSELLLHYVQPVYRYITSINPLTGKVGKKEFQAIY